MASLYCYSPVPINFHQEEKYTYYPLSYDGFTYFIDNKKLYYYLSAIGMLGEFLEDTEKDEPVSISRWMNSKDLCNSGFIAGISKYRVRNSNIKKISNYKVFSKDLDNTLAISDAIKNSFQAAIFYDFLNKSRDRFNSLVFEKLEEIKRDMYSSKEQHKLLIKQEHCKENIFKVLLNYFLDKANDDLHLNFEKLTTTVFEQRTNINLETDVDIYRVADIKKYSQKSFKVSNITQRECLREKTLLKIDLFQREVGISYLDFDEIQQKAFSFTKHKLEFEKTHILSLISGCEHIDSFNEELIDSSFECSEGDLLIREKPKIKTPQSIVDMFYYPAEISNCLIDSYSSLVNLAVYLNLDDFNRQILKEIAFGKINELESRFVKFSFKKAQEPFLPYGYAKVDYM